MCNNGPPHIPGDCQPAALDFRATRFDIKQEFADGFDPDRITILASFFARPPAGFPFARFPLCGAQVPVGEHVPGSALCWRTVLVEGERCPVHSLERCSPPCDPSAFCVSCTRDRSTTLAMMLFDHFDRELGGFMRPPTFRDFDITDEHVRLLDSRSE